jgi:hypothetical protein
MFCHKFPIGCDLSHNFGFPHDDDGPQHHNNGDKPGDRTRRIGFIIIFGTLGTMRLFLICTRPKTTPPSVDTQHTMPLIEKSI